MTRIISLKKSLEGWVRDYTGLVWDLMRNIRVFHAFGRWQQSKLVFLSVKKENIYLGMWIDLWITSYDIYIYTYIFFCCWESRHMIIMIWYDLVNQKKDMIWSCYRNVKWMTTFMMNYDSRCTLYIIIIYNKLITLSTKLFAFLIFVKSVLESIWIQLIFVEIEN